MSEFNWKEIWAKFYKHQAYCGIGLTTPIKECCEEYLAGLIHEELLGRKKKRDENGRR